MEEEPRSPKPIVKPPSSFSFKEGIDLYLTHNNNRVCVNISSWSGAERIYINGELCIKGRNLLSKTSKHSFTIGDDAYCVVINIKSLLKGDISVRLYLGDTVVDSACISLDEKFEEGFVDESAVSEVQQNHEQDDDKDLKPSTISSIVTSILGVIGTYFVVSQLFDWLFK
jgi:hypothetical protein